MKTIFQTHLNFYSKRKNYLLRDGRYKKPPLTGRWISHQCAACQHEFLLDLPRSKFAKLVHQWRAASCPRCGSKDVKVLGLVVS